MGGLVTGTKFACLQPKVAAWDASASSLTSVPVIQINDTNCSQDSSESSMTSVPVIQPNDTGFFRKQDTCHSHRDQSHSEFTTMQRTLSASSIMPLPVIATKTSTQSVR